MPRFPARKILCPTDFSVPATAAVRYAAGLSRCGSTAADLVLLYADTFEPPPYFTASEEAPMVASLERHRKAAEEQLKDYASKNAGPGAEALVVAQSPAQAILTTAASRNVDLIVMGTHGRTGVNRLMLGSVSERVLAEADRPVLTVREPDPPRSPASPPVRRVLCPVNYTDSAHRALVYASELAGCFGAEVLAVHVTEQGASAGAAADEKSRLCAWVPGGVRSACSVREIVRSGDAASEILALAREETCDLIVVGAEHKRFADTTVLGSTVVRVTRHAPLPVLTVFGN